MKIGNMPFLIAFLSSMFPMLGAALNFNIYHLPFFLVLATVGWVFIARQDFAIKVNMLTTIAAPAMFLILITQIITGRGFVTLGVGGYVLIFAIAFLGFFSSGAGVSLMSIVRGISLLYKFFLIGMLIELVLIMLGMQPHLVSFFSAVNSPGYKDYNSADVLRYFGFMKSNGGLNSVLLGSQVAGMLSLFATVWFFGISKLRMNEPLENYARKWMKLSILIYLITTNGLNLLLLVLACGIYTIYINKKNRSMLIFIFCILCVGLYLLIDNGLVLSRIFNNQDVVHLQPTDIAIAQKSGNLDEVEKLTTMGYYIFIFIEPVVIWLAEDWGNKLLGVGAPFFLNEDNAVAGDFGFAVGMLSSGFLWASIFLISVFVSCITAFKKVAIGSDEWQLWSVLGAINAMITLLWLASTIHYNQAFANPGGMMIFAMHFAATLYCHNRTKLSKSIVRHRTVSHE